MKVLLSIKPEYADKIFTGEKKYEYRKSIFKKGNVESILVYSTRPVGKIIGEIFFDEIIVDDPRNIWINTCAVSGISQSSFQEYFSGRESGYAIKINKAVLFKKPIELIEIINSGKAPQSFCYIK
ncbi:ASCH domain-containing protein [Paenibacillus sp. P36]|uniref:ASCH domain-containing protein n=1 Tax=Paenibacillus sp. P36 TaxID=3342538 RepID=UPI0038B2B612